MKTLRLQASLDNLPTAIEFIKAETARLGLPPDSVHDVELSCEEILVNVFSYAYPDATGELELGVDRIPSGGEIRIEIRDWGPKFDILAHPEPDLTLPLEHRGKGGLGIYLAKQLMDDILYTHDGGANTVTLVKRIDA